MAAEDNGSDFPHTDLRSALEHFVVDNDDLLAIESRIGRFNIFDALGITRVEIRHSNFLAFILDPAESHGQGQLFLKAFLMDLLKNAPAELRPFSPIDLDGTALRGVEIKREWKNVDLLITCKEPKFAVVIENKVGSQDHSNQLNRYCQTMKEHWPDLNPLFVYLTPDGEDPSEETEHHWLTYSYAEIHRVLKRVRDTYENAIGDDVLVFLDHYLNLLGSRFMNDEKLDELCRQIYKNHRQALDLIWERVGTPDSGLLAEVLDVVEHDVRWQVLYHSSNYVDFMPKGWTDWLMPLGADDQYPFCAHIRSRGGRLAYTMFVGPMIDSINRNDIVVKLREMCPELGFKRSKASQVATKWSRITAVETILEWSDDDEPDPGAARTSVAKMLDQLFPRLQKLTAILKPMCSVPAASGGQKRDKK